MKKDYLLKFLPLLLLCIGCFVSPIIIINDNSLLPIQFIAKYGWNPASIFILVIIIGAVIDVVLMAIKRPIYINFILVFLNIAFVTMAFLLKSIMSDYIEEIIDIQVGIGLIALVILDLIILIDNSSKLIGKTNITVQDMAEIAIFSAIALVLDLTFFKIRLGQNGGSISLVMLPLTVLSMRKGIVKGFICCGIVFGLLSCLIDGYGIVTYPLDYLGAFGSLSVVGLFKTFKLQNKKESFQVLGVIGFFALAIILRTTFATISGMVLYDTPFVGSLTYNLTYILPSAGIVLVLLIVLHKPILKLFVNEDN